MGKSLAILAAFGFALVAYVVQKSYNRTIKLPSVHPGYFGPGEPRPDRIDIVKIKIDIKNATLENLQQRLKQSRIHDSLEETNFEYGVNSKYLKTVS